MTIRVAVNGYARLNACSFMYQSLWSDPASWPGGTLPREGDDVTVQSSDNMLLDISPPALGSLRIEGRLVVSDDLVRSHLCCTSAKYCV